MPASCTYLSTVSQSLNHTWPVLVCQPGSFLVSSRANATHMSVFQWCPGGSTGRAYTIKAKSLSQWPTFESSLSPLPLVLCLSCLSLLCLSKKEMRQKILKRKKKSKKRLSFLCMKILLTQHMCDYLSSHRCIDLYFCMCVHVNGHVRVATGICAALSSSFPLDLTTQYTNLCILLLNLHYFFFSSDPPFKMNLSDPFLLHCCFNFSAHKDLRI